MSIGKTLIATANLAGGTLLVTMENTVTADRFLNYVNAGMHERGWSQADLVIASGLAPSAISNILSKKRRAGVDACRAIARAFGAPEEQTLRAAGLLKDQPKTSAIVEVITHLASALPEDEQQGIVEFIRMRKKLTEEKHAAAKRGKERSK